MDVAGVRAAGEALLDELELAIVGKRDVLSLVLVGLLADGHVLIEDVPGVAKTLIARSFAAVLQLQFSRVQFTPDLIPADITGSAVPDGHGQLRFQPGPVFANLVLGDEINRAPPKTQAAVLEAMEERQVTVDGHSHRLPRPFVVLATQNPIESEGTYPLPEAQLDRFLMRVSVGYPDAGSEAELLRRRVARRADAVALRPLLDAEAVLALQAAVETVDVAPDVLAYVVALARATRDDERTEAGASPRAALALTQAARAWAALGGRGFVVPDDVKRLAPAVLSHRMALRPEAWVRGVTGAAVVGDALASVPTPATLTTEDRRAATSPLAAGGGAPSGGPGAPAGPRSGS
jgi:MoxR-like ATPase